MEEGKKKRKYINLLGKDWRLQVGFCVASMVMLVVLYGAILMFIENSEVKDLNVVKDKNVFSIVDEITTDDRRWILSGWSVRSGSKLQEIEVLLVPYEKNENSIILETALVDNQNEKSFERYLNVADTSGSGFKATVATNKVKEDVCYEIQLYLSYTYSNMDVNIDRKELKESHSKISTGCFLLDGKIYSYNPLIVDIPMFDDEHMEQVIAEGRVVANSEENGAWLYEHEGAIYWILNKQFERNTDEDLFIFFHLNTTQKELLPELRKQYGFDNRDFLFSSYELELNEIEKYRVAKMSLDVEYPITYIRTGHYAEGKNLWSVEFAPLYME